jgi:hypothetical protein
MPEGNPGNRVDGENPGSVLRYVLTDLVKGCYILGALALDVFLIFQIYIWVPNFYSAALVVAVVMLLAIVEHRLYFFIKRILTTENQRGEF